MVWNAARPADSDRIRLSAELIRDNWVALESGTVPFDTISLENQVSFPALANHIRLFGYTNNASGQVELTSINPAGDRVRLTQGNKLGAVNQSAIFSSVQTGDVTFDGTFFYTGSLMPTARAMCAANGTTSMAVNMSTTRTGTGRYTLTIPAGILRVNSYAVLGQPYFNGASDTVILNVVSKPTVNVALPTTINIEILYRSDGTNRDAPFDVVIIGGRA